MPNTVLSLHGKREEERLFKMRAVSALDLQRTKACLPFFFYAVLQKNKNRKCAAENKKRVIMQTKAYIMTLIFIKIILF